MFRWLVGTTVTRQPALLRTLRIQRSYHINIVVVQQTCFLNAEFITTDAVPRLILGLCPFVQPSWSFTSIVSALISQGPRLRQVLRGPRGHSMILDIHLAKGLRPCISRQPIRRPRNIPKSLLSLGIRGGNHSKPTRTHHESTENPL